jgi:PhnB protein
MYLNIYGTKEGYMLIPHLHFRGNCEDAIKLYEKAFNTKVIEIVRNHDYNPEECAGDTQIAHASMKIHGQTIFLNDNEFFVKKESSFNFPVHLIIQFETIEELLACYDILKNDNISECPFEKTSYSELVGNFADKFDIWWGFMVL